MHSHRLRLKRQEWLLQWDQNTFRLIDPTGEPEVEDTEGRGYRYVDPYDLLCRKKIGFIRMFGTFEADEAAIEELRAYLEEGIKVDDEHREALKKDARVNAIAGPIAFLVCGGLFSLYCIWSPGAPDPAAGHWLRWVAPIIGAVLFLLLVFGMVGPFWLYKGMRVLRAISQIEARTKTDNSY
jgi:hypothetical protein